MAGSDKFLALALAASFLFTPSAVSVGGEEGQLEVSPQRALTGTGESAGAAAGQTKRGGKGFLNTNVIIGSVVAAATIAVAIEASSGTDSTSATSTTGTN
jgi:hypothetical protein